MIHPLPVVVAAVAAFVLAGGWYAAFGRMLPKLNPVYDGASTSAPQMLMEVLRCAVLAAVIALGCEQFGIQTVGGCLAAALVTWIGFPVVLLSGSVLHERVPWRLAAIHAGDWLLKLVAVALIVGLWS